MLSFTVQILAMCGNGHETSGYAELIQSAGSSILQTALSGGSIGAQSSDCSTTVTPTGFTFSIWGFIYSQTSTFYIPGVLDNKAIWHVTQANSMTNKWLEEFSSSPNNSFAVELLEDTACHLGKVKESLCTDGGFYCCAATQHHTWVKIATLLSRAILKKHGETCGGNTNSDAVVERLFSEAVGNELSTISMDESPPSNSVSSELATWVWAFRGLCEERTSGCLPITCVGCDAQKLNKTIAYIAQSSTRSYLSLKADLSCLL